MKKGFTLVELMGVIFVLGVITMIAIIAVDKTIKDNKEKLYQTQIANIEDAARIWGTKNIEYLPNDEYGAISIPLLILKKEGIIENDYKNPKTDDLFYNNSYIDIIYEDGTYNYDFVEESGSADEIEIDYPAIIFNEKWKLNNYYVVFDGWVIGENNNVITSPNVTIENDEFTSKQSFEENGKEFVVTRKVEDIGCKIVGDENNNKIADVGDQIACGTERFYVISNNGTNIDMLSKYRINLKTKIQNKNIEETDNVKFAGSDKQYWYTDSDNKTWNSKYTSIKYGSPGSFENIVSYIYDKEQATVSNGVIYYTVEYEKKLKDMGLTVSDVKLMSYEQALDLGCVQYGDDNKSYYTCGPAWVDDDGSKLGELDTYAPEWVWNVTYWLGSHTVRQDGVESIWSIDIDGSFDREKYNYGNYHGVRPVVTIPVTYLSSN